MNHFNPGDRVAMYTHKRTGTARVAFIYNYTNTVALTKALDWEKAGFSGYFDLDPQKLHLIARKQKRR